MTDTRRHPYLNEEWLESKFSPLRTDEPADWDVDPTNMEDAIIDAADALHHWAAYLVELSEERSTPARVAALRSSLIQNDLLGAQNCLNDAMRRLRRDFARGREESFEDTYRTWIARQAIDRVLAEADPDRAYEDKKPRRATRAEVEEVVATATEVQTHGPEQFWEACTNAARDLARVERLNR